MDSFNAIVPIVMSGLAAKAGDRKVTADDMLGFWGLGLSTVLANDTHLTTPKLNRLALEVVSKRLADQVASLREYEQSYGRSLLSVLLDGSKPQGSA